MLKSNLKRGVPAFTLLECLVALLVIAGSIQLYSNLTRVLASHVYYLSKSQEDEWLLFCQQMQGELLGSRLEKVSDNKLYVTKGKKSLAFGKSIADDFRKTNADGRGYQPMIFQVVQARVTETNRLVTFDFVFENGIERTFIYAFENES